MVVEEKLRNKLLYKVFLIILKYIPVVITLAYILNTALYWFNIDLSVLSNIAGLFLLPWIFIYVATYVFRFCTYHRLLLYYIFLDDCINIYDYYFGIPLSDHSMLAVHTVLIGILVIVLLVNHVKSNKKSISKDSR